MEEAISAVSLYALGPYWAQAIAAGLRQLPRFAVDRLPSAERHALHARMRPESGRALFETLNWWLDPFMTTWSTQAKIAAPILAIAGGQGRRSIRRPPCARPRAGSARRSRTCRR